MKIKKTTLKKYIKVIVSSKKKVFTCEDLSRETGDRVDVIQSYLVDFNPLINFDLTFNLKEVLGDMDYALIQMEEEPKKKKSKEITKKTIGNYKGLVDYIYKTMTIPGGLLDVGYVLNEKDLKIMTKLLKLEKEKLKK